MNHDHLVLALVLVWLYSIYVVRYECRFLMQAGSSWPGKILIHR